MQCFSSSHQANLLLLTDLPTRLLSPSLNLVRLLALLWSAPEVSVACTLTRTMITSVLHPLHALSQDKNEWSVCL